MSAPPQPRAAVQLLRWPLALSTSAQRMCPRRWTFCWDGLWQIYLMQCAARWWTPVRNLASRSCFGWVLPTAWRQTQVHAECPAWQGTQPQQSASRCAAGVALVSTHGGSKGKDAMLQLFEGYLERKVLQDMDEEAYDRVREGAVIFLGTLARHLEPSGPKVRAFLHPCIMLGYMPRNAGMAGMYDAACMFAGPRNRGDADGGAGNAFGRCADCSFGLPDAADAGAGRGSWLHGGAGAVHAEAAAAGLYLWRQVVCCIAHKIACITALCCLLNLESCLELGELAPDCTGQHMPCTLSVIRALQRISLARLSYPA